MMRINPSTRPQGCLSGQPDMMTIGAFFVSVGAPAAGGKSDRKSDCGFLPQAADGLYRATRPPIKSPRVAAPFLTLSIAIG
jgi:hypothetical protein